MNTTEKSIKNGLVCRAVRVMETQAVDEGPELAKEGHSCGVASPGIGHCDPIGHEEGSALPSGQNQPAGQIVMEPEGPPLGQ